MKKQYNCRFCKKIIVKDIITYLEKYPDEEWMRCPYCSMHFAMGRIRKEVEEKK